MFDQSVFLRKAGGGESGNRVRPIREWPLRLPHPSLSNVRVHDQFYPQAQAPARKVYDEQRSREFHYPTGKIVYLYIIINQFSKNTYLHIRWWPIEIPKKHFYASPMSLKCLHQSMELSTISTGWLRIDPALKDCGNASVIQDSTHQLIHYLAGAALLYQNFSSFFFVSFIKNNSVDGDEPISGSSGFIVYMCDDFLYSTRSHFLDGFFFSFFS